MIKTLDDERFRLLSAAHATTLFGNAAAILSGCPRYNKATFGQVAGFLATAVRHRQIKCYFDERNHLVGLVVWMWFDDVLLQKMSTESAFPPAIDISEWKEGDVFFIPALVALRDSFGDIIEDILCSIPPGTRAISWINHRKNTVQIHSASRIQTLRLRRVHASGKA